MRMIEFRAVMVAVATLLATSVPAAHAQRPDLIVSALNTPDGLKQGSCNRFDVTVENLQTAATSQSITLKLELQFANGGHGQYLKTINGIGGRASRMVTFGTVAIPALGTAAYTVTVNPDGIVPEAVIDERNSASNSGTVSRPCALH